MYTFVSSYLRANTPNAPYQHVDISQIPLLQLFSQYSDGYITFSNPALTQPAWVDLNALRSAALPFKNQPVVVWLAHLGNHALPTLESEPVYTTNTVKYRDAIEAGYTLSRISQQYPAVEGLSIGAMESAYLVSGTTNVSLLHTSALTTVNGLLHLNVPYSQGLIIQNASVTLDKTGINTVGLLSFSTVGYVTQLPITDSMIDAPDPANPEALDVYISLGVDISNKSVLLSLGGYLHISDKVYTVINRELGLIKVSFDQFDIVRRVLDSMNIIDLSGLDGWPADNYVGSISPQILSTRAFMLSYLKLSQSFFIIVDTPSIYSIAHPLSRTPITGLYETMVEPVWPYIDTCGKMPEYWARLEFDMYTISLAQNRKRDPIFQSTEWQQLPSVNSVTPPSGYRAEVGRLLEIGTTIKTA